MRWGVRPRVAPPCYRGACKHEDRARRPLRQRTRGRRALVLGPPRHEGREVRRRSVPHALPGRQRRSDHPRDPDGRAAGPRLRRAGSQPPARGARDRRRRRHAPAAARGRRDGRRRDHHDRQRRRARDAARPVGARDPARPAQPSARGGSAEARPCSGGSASLVAGLAASFGWVGLLHAQDTRRVSEPSLPPACAVLEARLAAPAGVLSEESERSPDTSRIQGAIDGCAPGKAVVLARAGEKDVFLTGPLRLRPGVALVVAERTALFASRNPRDYDVEPGSCGVLRPVDRRGPGCRPLLLAEDAPGSGVMGPGAIDGRGGAKMIGDDRSWWELAKQAKVLDLQQSCPRLLIVRRSNDFVLYRITLRNSPNFHVVAEQTDGFTAWGVQDQDAEDRAQHGRDRSLLLHERHDRPQLHRHRRRQRGDQVGPGRQGRADHDRAQPLLLRPRDVDRQRHERRRQRRARQST